MSITRSGTSLSPVIVEVQRPHRSGAEIFGEVVGLILNFIIRGLLVWWIGGLLFPVFVPSFGVALGLVFLADLFFDGKPRSYMSWTRSGQ